MEATGKVWLFYHSQTKKQTKPLSTVQAQVTLLTFKNKDLKYLFIWTPGWSNWQPLEAFLHSEQNTFALRHPPKPPGMPVHESASGENPQSEVTYKDITVPEEAEPATEQVSEDTFSSRTDGSGYTKVVAEEAHRKEDYGYYFNDFNGHELDLAKIKKVSALKMKREKKSAEEDENRRTAIRHSFKLEVVLINKERSFRTFSKNISLGGTLLEDEVPKDFLNKPFELIVINRFEPDKNKGRLLFKAKIVGDIVNPRRLMFLDADPQMVARLNALLKAYVTYQEQMKKQVG